MTKQNQQYIGWEFPRRGVCPPRCRGNLPARQDSDGLREEDGGERVPMKSAAGEVIPARGASRDAGRHASRSSGDRKRDAAAPLGGERGAPFKGPPKPLNRAPTIGRSRILSPTPRGRKGPEKKASWQARRQFIIGLLGGRGSVISARETFKGARREVERRRESNLSDR